MLHCGEKGEAMSRHQYPRWGSSRPLKGVPSKPCGIKGCAEPATWVVEMEFSYMRGENGVGVFCKAYRDRGMGDPGGMCMSAKEGAWK